MDASPQISTGTPLDSVVSSLNGKTMDNATNQKGLSILMRDTDKVRQEEKNIPLAKPPELTKAPDQKDYTTNPMETFGSFGMILASLGSLMTRHPMTSALNAGAEVFKAKSAGDAAGYKNAMDKWKVDSENAWKMADWDQKNFENMRSKYKDDLEGLNREAELWAAATKNPALDAAAKAGRVQEYFDNHQKAVQGALDAKENKEKKNLIYQAKQDEWLDNNLNPNGSRKTIKEIPKTVTAKNIEATENEWKQSEGGKLSGYTGNVDFDSAARNPNDKIPGTDITYNALKRKVDTLHTTGSYAKAGISMRGNNNGLKDAADDLWSKLYPNDDAGTIATQYSEQQTEGKIAAKNYESMKVATDRLDKSIPLLMEKVKAVNPGQFKSWNDFENYLAENSGDPKIIALQQVVEDTKTDFQAVQAKGGDVTDKVRSSSDRILNAAWAKGQFKAAVDTMLQTSKNQMAAAQESKESVTRKNGGGETPEVRTQAEYDALPPDTEYMEDGVKYRKPK